MENLVESTTYTAVMERREAILERSLGIDYSALERGGGWFDYEALMDLVGLDLDGIRQVQRDSGVGQTPLIELHNVTELVRREAGPGKGARIFVKDEAANPSGSFKDRRASLSAYYASRAGYAGMSCPTWWLMAPAKLTCGRCASILAARVPISPRPHINTRTFDKTASFRD
jgi:hypothetical protein